MTDSEVLLDFDRESRTGIGEAVFCQGKTPAQLLTICDQLDSSKRMLFTRLTSEQFAIIESAQPDLLDYDEQSRTAWINPLPDAENSDVAIITGGSTDVAVAREAARTLAFYGYGSNKIDDVGVAGLWRLLDRIDEIKQHKIIIAIAGMDAALPTVLGGLISSTIIAVPTSVGYGATRGGETALASLLVSCASGITVTNIDNGFGAACAAIRILHAFR
ncbi:MAG: NCAIR mutase (PurE)-related protein [Candidatus Azotimanducaceae bacterium]